MSTTPVDPVLEMQINGEWIDITADCRQADADSGGGFEVTRGVPNEGNFAEPTQLNFVLNNGESKVASTLGQTGVYSPMNPMGPYFGQLGQNQRVRLGLFRRSDDFNRTESQGWGYVPDRLHADGATTVVGEQWHQYGNPGGFSVSAGVASIVGAASLRMALIRRTYRDVEIRAKLRVDALTSEIGLVTRCSNFVLEPPSGVQLDGSTGWTSSNSTLAVDTGVFRGENTQSLRMTVTGTPSSAAISNIVGTTTMWACPRGSNSGYYMRVWVRSSQTTTVRAIMSWYQEDGSSFISSTTQDTAVTANTWTPIDVTASTTPQDTHYVRLGMSFPSGTSPQNGWQLWIQDPEVHDISQIGYLTAGVLPGTPDVPRIYKSAAGQTQTSDGAMSSDLTTGVDWWFKAQQAGQRTRIKVWLASEDEPVAWTHRYYDDKPLEQNSVGRVGEVGVYILGAGATLQVRELIIDQWRAHAEITELPPLFDLSRQIHWVPVQARGITRRLGQGRKSLRSAVSMHLEEYSSLSYGWWPLEADLGDSAGNNVERGIPGTISGITISAPDAGSGITSLNGVSGVATLTADTSAINLSVLSHAATADKKETMFWFVRLPALPASELTVATLYSTGTARTFKVNVTSGGALRVTAYDRTGASLSSFLVAMWNGNSDLPTGCWLAFALYMTETAGTVSYILNHHRPGSSTFWSGNSSHAGSVGVLTGINFRSSSVHTAAGNMQIGQVMHYAGDLPFVTYAFSMAARAYDQETAGARALRVAGNANIPVTSTGFSTISVPMGVQSPTKALDLMGEAGEADAGLVLEERDDFGLTFVTRNSMWNRDPLELDIDAGHLTEPLEAKFDDQQTRNDSEISRPNGSFRRAVVLSGPKNANPPETDPEGVGSYDEQKTINVGTDDLCGSQAWYRVSRGTLPGPRYPSLTAILSSEVYEQDHDLAIDAMGLDVGDAMILTNTESDYIPRRQQIQGYTENIRDLYEWELNWTNLPGDTRRAGVVNYSTRVGAADLVTDADFLAGTDTTLLVTSPNGRKLVRPDRKDLHLPLDIDVAGVRLRVTSVGQILNATNSDMESGTTGWSASSANATLGSDLWDPKRGSRCLRVTVAAAGTDGAVTAAANRATVTAATNYLVCGWVKTEAAATDFQIAVNWHNSGGGLISTTLPGSVAFGGLGWTWFSAVVTSPALSAFAAVYARNVFAGAGQRMWLDNIRIYAVSSYDGDPQTVVVEQTPINANFGIAGKTIPAGSRIEIVDAMRVGWGASQ